MPYFDVPEAEREERCFLKSDLCVVDDARFFVQGTLELPLAGSTDRLVVGVWAEIGDGDVFEYQDLLDVRSRSAHGPYSGHLSAAIPTYSQTEGLAVQVCLNEKGIRPSIVILDSSSELGRDQAHGLPLEKVQAIYSYFEARRAAG
jgi:hypothetical protein